MNTKTIRTKNCLELLIDNNSTFHIWGLNPKWTQFFPTTYNARKELYYDFICDAETKMRIARINDNFTPDEIDNLISQREVVKDLLNRKEHYKQLEQENKALQEKIEELRQIHSLLGNCPTEKFDEIKNFINDFTIKDASIKDGETPLGEDDKKDILVVPKTYEIEDILEEEFQEALIDGNLEQCLQKVQMKAEAVVRE